MPSWLITAIFSILSFTPLFSVAAFFAYKEATMWIAITISIAIFVLCELICKGLLDMCKNKYEVINFKINEINPINKDLVNFLTATLVPFLAFFNEQFSLGLGVLIFIMLFYLIFVTDTLYYNIAMSFLGYKSYEVKNNSGLNYILFSKRDFCNKEQIGQVIQINKFIVLDYDGK